MLRAEDTRQLLGNWVDANLPLASKVAVEGYSLLDVRGRLVDPRKIPCELRALPSLGLGSIKGYEEDGFEYLIASSFVYGRDLLRRDAAGGEDNFYRQLDRELPLVAAFSPAADGREPPFGHPRGRDARAPGATHPAAAVLVSDGRRSTARGTAVKDRFGGPDRTHGPFARVGETPALPAFRDWRLSPALLSLACAVSFAAFVRVTLYGRAGLADAGAKGILLPAFVLLAVFAWIAFARLLLNRSRHLQALASLTFLPLLATLPVTIVVLASESAAADYWVARSLKVELLLGTPALALALQAVAWIWLRRRLSWRKSWPVVAILAAGLALRLAGMGWGLPFAFQPEEATIYVRRAWELSLNGQWNPRTFVNPSLLIYWIGLEFGVLFAACRALAYGQTSGELYMVFRSMQDLFYGMARLNSVLLGAATILPVYLIARRLWSERSALLAAALLAVNFLHVRNSQYGVNDVPSTFFLALSLYFAVRIMEDGRTRHYLLAGLMAGLAASTKYNAGMIVVSLVAAHWAHQGSLTAPLRRAPLTKLVLSGVMAFGGFVAGTPFSLLDATAFLQGFVQQAQMGGVAWRDQAPEPVGWLYLASIAHGAGWAPSVLALAGSALLVARDRKAAGTLLSFLVGYLVFMSAMKLFFVRWAVPAMPLVALLGAYAVDEVMRILDSGRRRWTTVGFVALVVLQPAAQSLHLDSLLRQPDTRQEANAWARQNIPPGFRVAVEEYSLLDQETVDFRPSLRHLDVAAVWRATSYDLDFYRTNGFDYLAVSSFLYGPAIERPDRYRDRAEFYRRLDREYPLAAAFYPRDDRGTPPFELDDLDTPFWRLFSYDRPGPAVKIYQISGRSIRYGVEWLEASVPAEVLAGQSVDASVSVRNTGSAPWPVGGESPVRLGYRWSDSTGKEARAVGEHGPFPHDVAPGEQVVVPLKVVAPSRPGVYRLRLDVVQENFAWLSDRGASVHEMSVMVR